MACFLVMSVHNATVLRTLIMADMLFVHVLALSGFRTPPLPPDNRLNLQARLSGPFRVFPSLLVLCQLDPQSYSRGPVLVPSCDVWCVTCDL